MSSHRAGNLKQKNKGHKLRHASKGEAKKTQGRQSARTSVKARVGSQSKSDRRNRAKQLRAAQMDAERAERRSESWKTPQLVTLVPVSPDADVHAAARAIVGELESAPALGGAGATILADKHRRVTVVPLAARDGEAVLEAARVSDLMVYVYAPLDDSGMMVEGASMLSSAGTAAMPDEWVLDETSRTLISLVKAQGMPAGMHLFQPRGGSERRAARLKRLVSRIAKFYFSEDDRVLPAADGASVRRFIALSHPRDLHWRAGRAFVVPDAVEHSPDGVFRVAGFLRGGALSADQLLHITDWGDYAINAVHVAPLDADGNPLMDQLAVASTPTDDRMPLEATQAPDTLMNEQNLSEDEDDERAAVRAQVQRMLDEKADLKRRGVSEAEQAWRDMLGEPNDEGESNGEGESNMSDDASVEMDDLEITEAAAMPRRMRDEVDTSAMDEDVHFPDEVDAPADLFAKVRFARYRGLDNFRQAKWDPMEALPVDYARIFRLEQYQRIQREEREAHGGVAQGSYVVVDVAGVPPEAAQQRAPVISALFPHEQRWSVVHVSVTKTDAAAELTVRNKDPLVVCAGFRRYVVRPLLSEPNPKSDKHKMARFMHAERETVLSFYGPAFYSPAPVMVFSAPPRLSFLEPLAYGSLLSVDTQRIILKKAVLTGVPFKVHRFKAVVRGMFHNADDVRWFMPVKLRTKMGRVGVISAPLGTHGLMKCRFDGNVSQQDTIVLELFKRVFPKWNTTILLPRYEAVPDLEHPDRDDGFARPRLTAANLALLP